MEELKKFIGQELKVKILDVNPRTFKFILSEREVTNQNVKEKLTKYKAGDIVEGIVSGVADFGAFVEIFPGTEGLVHISKLSDQRVARVEDVVRVGDVITVKLMEIDEKGRLNLSMKDAQQKG